MKKLYEILENELGKRPISNTEIPEYITQNLKHSLFEWQKSALQYFLNYNKIENNFLKLPTHLMFNMATGSGKTLLMAACLLYYYKQGYRHFLFFVNRNNIIDKTENNFIENTHNKYLFKEKIVFDNKTVPIKKVTVFSEEPQAIEIKFTTVQKLYNDIHLQKENQTTLEDLHKKNIVMLADEAHHLNTETKRQEILETTELKKSASKEEVERRGWEHTVIDLILKKQGKEKENKNVLLEFTATIPETEKVKEKYKDKIISQFGLKQFLQAGYTKGINLISSTLPKKERVLQALLFSWYRSEIALKNGIANFKPVVLFRSKTIPESEKDYQDFLRWIEEISSSDFGFVKTTLQEIIENENNYEMGKSRTNQVLKYIKQEKIHFREIAYWIKSNYLEKNVIIINSKQDKKKEKMGEKVEKLLNSLEDKNNSIRAIFTVEQLTEGWDVLNLFDIVRLYEGQNSGGSTKKTPEATIKEKQLIGRGVRYFPFDYKETLPNKRKFDKDLEHPLRVLEELYYYTYDEDSRYISHLKKELREDGYIDDNKMILQYEIKADFKKKNFYKKTPLYYNEQEDNLNEKKDNLNDIIKNITFSYSLPSSSLIEDNAMLQEEEKTSRGEKKKGAIDYKIGEIEKHIFQKAIHMQAKKEGSPFRFENLQHKLQVKTTGDLQEKLADEEVSLTADEEITDSINNEHQLKIALKVLDKIAATFNEEKNKKKGGEFKEGSFDKFFGEAKIKTIKKDLPESTLFEKKDWYVLNRFTGTSEEKSLLDFIDKEIQNLKKKYKEVYLLRNEEVYKIYDFQQGRGFQPDFLLFLKGEKTNENLYYQIFIEPKGDEYKDENQSFTNSKEGWKQNFLKAIYKKYGKGKLLQTENKKYRLIGLPFYNKECEEKKRVFKKKWNKYILEEE